MTIGSQRRTVSEFKQHQPSAGNFGPETDMGIELKDLQPGTYYKGYHAPSPQGAKCFYYVKSKVLKGQGVEVEAVWHLRGSALPPRWVPVTFTGPPDHSSLIKHPTSPGEIKKEGLTFPVPKPGTVSVPVERSNANLQSSTAKTAIPENAKSPKCMKCGGDNKLLAMFSGSSYFCPVCEP